jgi:hypothetical protein
MAKVPHVLLNTNMQFGSAYDKDFKGCSTSEQLRLQSSLWQDSLFILDTEEIELPKKVPVRCPFCDCCYHPGGVVKDGWVPSVRAILTATAAFCSRRQSRPNVR